MQCFYLFFFILYLFSPNNHYNKTLKESCKNIKTLKKEALIKIFKEPKFKNPKFVKHPETLTNWNCFINVLNELLKHLKTTLVTFPSQEKEDFYKDLTIFLDHFTSFLLWEKNGEPELENINCSQILLSNSLEKSKYNAKDSFIEKTLEIFDHIEQNLHLFKNYLLIENNLIFLNHYLKLQTNMIKLKENLIK